MGGGSYDRDVYSSYSSGSSTSWGTTKSYSTESSKVMSRSRPTNDMTPSVKGNLICEHENPIVIAFDVTGSMGEAPRIMYDKFPMFWGELVKKNYLPDPSVSFFAIGDVNSDSYPLQLCQFGEGIVLDELMKKLYLEGGGGPAYCESYELCAYYYAHCCNLKAAKLPFFFFIGDEDYYKDLSSSDIKKYCDKKYTGQSKTAAETFAALKKNFKNNTFLLHKEYGAGYDDQIVRSWKEVLGNQNVHNLKDPKAVVDMMLGIIALVSEARTLGDYLVDMKSREQTDERIALVESNLSDLENSLVSTVDSMPSTSSTTKRTTGSRRL